MLLTRALSGSSAWPIVERMSCCLRSILAAVLRSIHAADLRNIPAADLRSIPAAVLRSILDAVLRNTAHADWSSIHLPVDDILRRVAEASLSFPRNDHPTIYEHASKFQQRMRSDYVPIQCERVCVYERERYPKTSRRRRSRFFEISKIS